MLEHRTVRLANIRRRTLVIAMTLMAPLAALGVASPALAAPTGVYSVFAQCPTAVPSLFFCVNGQITSGELAIGDVKVPITKTLTLQGGGLRIGAEGGAFLMLPAVNGESLSQTGLEVPGGLRNFIDCEELKGRRPFLGRERAVCRAIVDNGRSKVTATLEPAANEHNPVVLNLGDVFEGQGPGITLPIKIHLSNPWLGRNCYIGSESSPIELQLTDGTTSPPPPNTPISGKLGSIAEEEEVAVFNGGSFVDNSFSTPAAEGCGHGGFLSFFIDHLLDEKLGASPAGTNTAIFNTTIRIALVSSVVGSET